LVAVGEPEGNQRLTKFQALRRAVPIRKLVDVEAHPVRLSASLLFLKTRPSVPQLIDLLPAIRREVYMILRNEEERDVEGEAKASGDDWGVEADGGGTSGGGRSAGTAAVRCFQTLTTNRPPGNSAARSKFSNVSSIPCFSM
jgi:hypothetical protein